jgi:signal transduction histidine kinase
MTGSLAVLNALLGSVAFCALLAGALAYSYWIYRQRYLFLWSIFWAICAGVWGISSLMSAGVGSPLAVIALRTVMSASGYTARVVFALSIGAYLGWRSPAKKSLWLLALAIVVLITAGITTNTLAASGHIPRIVATPFRNYSVGFFLDLWLAFQLFTSEGPRLSRRLLGIAIASSAVSDGLDVALDLFVGNPFGLSDQYSLVSTFVAHVCEILFAAGMMVAAIGTEYERAEAGAAELRERDARLHESQRREMLGRLAGGLAHDFNNLLTAVIAHLGFAREALPAGSEVRLDVETAEAAAVSGSRLTRQLLTFAKRQPVVPQAIDLNQLLGRLERLTTPLLGAAVQRQQALASMPWPVRADAMQLEQLVLNLILNARDAMPAGGTLRIETANESSGPTSGGGARVPGEWVRLTIADSGHGMDEATRARAFEPFFTTKQSGTGLGLSTVQAVVQQAGGQLELNTAPGQGARFDIWLPRLLGEPRVEDEPHLRALSVGAEATRSPAVEQSQASLDGKKPEPRSPIQVEQRSGSIAPRS